MENGLEFQGNKRHMLEPEFLTTSMSILRSINQVVFAQLSDTHLQTPLQYYISIGSLHYFYPVVVSLLLYNFRV